MGFGSAERALVGQLALHLGFPRDEASLRRYLSGEDAALVDLLPELAALRDAAFYVSASMVPSLDSLPEIRGWNAEDAKLAWRWKEDKKGKPGRFAVRGFGGDMHCGGWSAAADDDEEVSEDGAPPPPPPGGPPPPPGGTPSKSGSGSAGTIASAGKGAFALGAKLRAKLAEKLGRAPRPRLPPSAADPSSLAGTQVDTEDDVLHLKHLPELGGALRQADVEALLQMLTVPYLRVPLLLRFFADASRTAALAQPELQRVLDAALFEPGEWRPPSEAPPELPTTIPPPDLDRSHLATAAGTLFHELAHSPVAVLGKPREQRREWHHSPISTSRSPSIPSHCDSSFLPC